MTAPVRQCVLCETMRPETKMTKDRKDNWTCTNRDLCKKAQGIRDAAAETDEQKTVFLGYPRDSSYGKGSIIRKPYGRR